ncbi:unnamed protein product [Effrenium voratum]|nr:unnamed protein product [Effrenium voratum]
MWACECGFSNRESNTVCGGTGQLGCKAPRPTAAAARNGYGDKGSEWHCSCGFRNRSHNTVCGGTGRLGCRQARPPPGPPAAPPDARAAFATTLTPPPPPGLEPPREEREGQPDVWYCGCGFRNRPTNTRCGGNGTMGCGLARPVETPEPALAPPLPPLAPPPWVPAVLEQEEKEQGAIDAPQAAIDAPAGAASGGAWVCSCGWRNQACNDKCGGFGPLGCKTARPQEPEPVKEQVKWLCKGCDSENAGEALLSCSFCDTARRFKGVLKSIGGDYSFISCPETVAAYGRDVYVSKAVLGSAFRRGGSATSGLPVSFSICLNDAKQPNARHVYPLERGAAEDEAFHGTVKYMSEEKGYGFIECQETMDCFGSDVHADLEHLRQCSLGQPVVFRIRLGAIGGRPQVRQLSVAGPAPEALPGKSAQGFAAELTEQHWAQALLLGEGDFSFAAAAAVRHSNANLVATTVMKEDIWRERFPEHGVVLESLRACGHSVRFEVDAREVDCSGYRLVVFNFPAVSAQEADAASGEKDESSSGALARAFLRNAARSGDDHALVVLGLWGRCDGKADSRLYGQDAHELVASAVAEEKRLEDALPDGYVRSGVHADYGFYTPYAEEGYNFRTNCTATFAPRPGPVVTCCADVGPLHVRGTVGTLNMLLLEAEGEAALAILTVINELLQYVHPNTPCRLQIRNAFPRPGLWEATQKRPTLESSRSGMARQVASCARQVLESCHRVPTFPRVISAQKSTMAGGHTMPQVHHSSDSIDPLGLP